MWKAGERWKSQDQKGNQEVGRIHAENAIRQHSQSINFLKLAARLDSVASRLKSVQTAQLMGKNLENVSKVMGVAMQRMNLERNFDVLESFDKQCNELDTQMNILEGAMSQSTATLTPDNQVEALMQQVADEHGLDVSISLNQIGLPNANTVAQTSTQTKIDKTRTVDEEMKSWTTFIANSCTLHLILWVSNS